MKTIFAILTMAVGEDYQNMVDRAIKHNAKYAEKWGYHFNVFSYTVDKRGISWSKLHHIKRFMQAFPEIDWILWVDADTVITDWKKPLTYYSDFGDDFVFSTDATTILNGGVWMVRNVPRTIDVIDQWINSKTNDPRLWEQIAIIDWYNRNPAAWEQTKIAYDISGVYQDMPVDNIIRSLLMKHNLPVNHPDIEPIREEARKLVYDPDWHFVCHFAGRTVEQRSLQSCINKVLDKWEQKNVR